MAAARSRCANLRVSGDIDAAIRMAQHTFNVLHAGATPFGFSRDISILLHCGGELYYV